MIKPLYESAEYIAVVDEGIETWSGFASECLRRHVVSSDILSFSYEDLRDLLIIDAPIQWHGSVVKPRTH